MSRVGKQPIEFPKNVEVKIDGDLVIVKGPKGQLQTKITRDVKVEIENNQIEVIFNEKRGRYAMWGTTRALLANMISGVVNGFEKKLQIEGVGYRATSEGKDLVLSLGFSHPVRVKPIEGVNLVVEKNKIFVSGIDKQAVGQMAAYIRSLKKPEPYKGKGIRYENEIIRRKAGKKSGDK